MKSRTLAVVMAALLVMGMTGASAYTTATADRDVSVTVKSDDSGVIQLQEGDTGASIESGELVIDADDENLNLDAEFIFGDKTDPQASNAFTLTNNNGNGETYTYTLNSTGDDVAYYIAADETGDGTAESTYNVTPGGSNSFTLQDGDTAYVAVSVNTDESTADINGTLRIRAE